MTRQRIAKGLCALAIIMVATGPVLQTYARHEALLYSLALGAVQISTAIVGAVVASRLPENAVGWVLLGIGTALGVSNTGGAYGTLGTRTSRGPLPGDHIAAWVGSWSFTPTVIGGVMILLYIFPNGQFVSTAWRRTLQVSLVFVGCATAAEAFTPGHMDDATGIVNPFGASGAMADVVRTTSSIVNPIALPAFALAVTVLVVRFRRSRGIERLQLKWITSALVLVAVNLGLTAASHGAFGKVTFFLALFSLAAMPVSIGFAVLRYRLYDIDVVINRALVYGALTATLAAVYLGSVLLLQLALRPFTQGSSLAIAVSTLAVAAMFRPLRARVQESVDRRFFRKKYDAHRTLETFGTHLRDQVDLEDIGTDLLSVIRETVQPSHVSLWLRSSGGAG